MTAISCRVTIFRILSNTVTDNATYSTSYGEKEITYLQSIETASEVAYFQTSPRLDGMGSNPANYPRQIAGAVEATTTCPPLLDIPANGALHGVSCGSATGVYAAFIGSDPTNKTQPSIDNIANYGCLVLLQILPFHCRWISAMAPGSVVLVNLRRRPRE